MKKTLLKDKTGNTLSPFVDMDSVLDWDGRALPEVLEENNASVSREIMKKADKSDIPSDFVVVTVETPYEEIAKLYKKHGFKIILDVPYNDESQYFVLSTYEQSEYVFINILMSVLHEWRRSQAGWTQYDRTIEYQNNKVTRISSASNDTQYPSAKTVYDEVQKRVMVVSPGDIMEDHTDELSYLTSLIYVQGNARILPVTLDGRGWLYEWQNGWRIADVSGYTATNKNWLEFLTYMNGHSVPLGGGGGSIDSRPVAEETATPLFPYLEYVPQNLTFTQQEQARKNIDAASETDLETRVQVVDVNDEIPSQGIPRMSLILVMDGDNGKVAEILPSCQGEEYGWLYDWQEGWRIVDVSGFDMDGRTWLELLQYMDENSTPLDVLTYGVVRHDVVQSLNDTQKAQVRDNIGAAEEAELTALQVDVGKDHTQLTNLQAKVNGVEQFTQVLDEDIATIQEDLEEIREDITGKQDKLTAGANITIENNVISSTGGGTGGSKIIMRRW